MKPSIIIFDVNETLLDMSDVKNKVNKALDSESAFTVWFSLVLQYALVDTVVGNYHDFGMIAKATLQMAAEMLETRISDDDQKDILNTMKNIPAHDDVKRGLTLLKDAGYRLATLTNSPPSALQNNQAYREISGFFEASISIDEFKIYKPHIDVYNKTVQKTGVRPGEALLIAAHGWDIAGALAAGMQAAFIERKGQSLYPLAPGPQYRGKDLIEVARAIIKQ